MFLISFNPLLATVAFCQLITILLWLTPYDFTLANARRFYSSRGELPETRLIKGEAELDVLCFLVCFIYFLFSLFG